MNEVRMEEYKRSHQRRSSTQLHAASKHSSNMRQRPSKEPVDQSNMLGIFNGSDPILATFGGLKRVSKEEQKAIEEANQKVFDEQQQEVIEETTKKLTKFQTASASHTARDWPTTLLVNAQKD